MFFGVGEFGFWAFLRGFTEIIFWSRANWKNLEREERYRFWFGSFLMVEIYAETISGRNPSVSTKVETAYLDKWAVLKR
jgi:hypothetical protein